MDISQQKCFNHQTREAAARCPLCGHFFCRECVTEHADRVICALCMRKIPTGRAGFRFRAAGLAMLLQCAAAFLLLWLMLYETGRLLQSLPSSFHEGTLWREIQMKAGRAVGQD